METLYVVDLDGVVFNFLNPFLDYANEVFGVHIQEEHIIMPGFEHFPCPVVDEKTTLSPAEWVQAFEEFEHSGAYERLPLMHGARVALKHIHSASSVLLYLTARKIEYSQDTIRAIEIKGLPRGLLYFDAHKKWELIRSYRGRFKRIVLVEDQLRNMVPASPFIDRGYLMAWTHNSLAEPPMNILRVRGWGQILEAEFGS